MENQMQTSTHEKPITVMNVQQAGQYLGLAVSTLNKWRCHGGGPIFIKLGRAVRYRVEDLDAFLNERRASSTTDFETQY